MTVDQKVVKYVVIGILILCGAGELINFGRYVAKTIMGVAIDIIWGITANLGLTGLFIAVVSTIAIALLYVSYKGRSIV